MSIEKVPVVRTLLICTNASRKNARTELLWNIGFAFLQVFLIAMIVFFSRSLSEMPSRIWGVIRGGELMIYAASVCGAVLYSLRHNFDGPIPEALRNRATPLGTLTVITAICMSIAVLAYVIRRLGQLNNFPVNETTIDVVSIILFITSITVAYVVFSLKHSLASGAAIVSHEQTTSFAAQWEGNRDA